MGSLSHLQGKLPNLGIESRSPPLQADCLAADPPGKGKNAGVGSLSLLQRIFPTQESNWGLLHCRRILDQLSHTESNASVPGKTCNPNGPPSPQHTHSSQTQVWFPVPTDTGWPRGTPKSPTLTWPTPPGAHLDPRTRHPHATPQRSRRLPGRPASERCFNCTPSGCRGFPACAHGTESACPCRRPSFDPGVGKIPWR